MRSYPLVSNVNNLVEIQTAAFQGILLLTRGAFAAFVQDRQKEHTMAWEFWVDRGGTFTDIVAQDPGWRASQSQAFV
jgi:hypothetical protein